MKTLLQAFPFPFHITNITKHRLLVWGGKGGRLN